MKKLITLAVASLFIGSSALATELEFSPDRPGYSDSVGTTPPGQLATEMGVSLAAGQTETNATFPNILIKVGVVPNLELRAVIPGMTFYSYQVRFGDVGVGMKFGAGNDKLKVSLVPTLWIPMHRSVSERWVDDGCFCVKDSYGTMNINVQVYPWDKLWLGVGGTVLATQAISGSAGYSIDDWGFFVQAYGIQDVGSYAGAGVTYVVTPYVQVDFGIDYGFLARFNEDVAQVNAYTGLALMWQ